MTSQLCMCPTGKARPGSGVATPLTGKPLVVALRSEEPDFVLTPPALTPALEGVPTGAPAPGGISKLDYASALLLRLSSVMPWHHLVSLSGEGCPTNIASMNSVSRGAWEGDGGS